MNTITFYVKILRRHFENKHWVLIDMSARSCKMKKRLFNLMLFHQAIIVIEIYGF